MFGFEKLEVWQKAIELSDLGPSSKLSRRGGQSQFAPKTPQIWDSPRQFWDRFLVYALRRSFPSDERFRLTSQRRRSAISSASNIAEGSGRNSNHEFVRFIEIAYGSLMELITQGTIARHQDFLKLAEFEDLYSRAQKVVGMLSGLKSSLRNQKNS